MRPKMILALVWISAVFIAACNTVPQEVVQRDEDPPCIDYAVGKPDKKSTLHLCNYIEDRLPQSAANDVLVIADTQIHYLFGSYSQRSTFGDTISSVAVRPIHSDLYAHSVVDRAVKEYAANRDSRGLLVHLGDIADVACESELADFATQVGSSVHWVAAPGNHDVAFLGTYEKVKEWPQWDAACAYPKSGSARLSKRRFISNYLGMLSAQSSNPSSDPSFVSFSNCLNGVMQAAASRSVYPCLNQHPQKARGERRNCGVPDDFDDRVNCTPSEETAKWLPNSGWWKYRQGNGYLRDVFWYINPSQKHGINSFIVQSVQIGPRAYVVLLDSSNPKRGRGVTNFLARYNAANDGTFTDLAGIAIRKILDDLPSGSLVALASHHPRKDFNWQAQTRLCKLFESRSLELMLSAHSHRAKLYRPGSSVRKGCEGTLELNVSSMIDEPIEYRMIRADATDVVSSVFNVTRRSVQISEKSMECDPEWQRSSGEYSYTAYHSVGGGNDEMQAHLLKAALYELEQVLATPQLGTAFRDAKKINKKDYVTDKAVLADVKALRATISPSNWMSKRFEVSELLDFLRSRAVKEPSTWNRYQQCQAAWAAKFEKQ